MIEKDLHSEHVTRAWATLEIKKVGDGETRTIKGIASTPTTDRMGDIVEPMGLEFAASVPLIWQHRHDQPLGTATFDPPTKNGVTFTAKFADIQEPGALKSRIDDAWQAVKAGIVRGVSIGFRALERNFMDDGGVRFVRSEIVELSIVTVAANAEASISQIKKFDAASLAASGDKSEARKLPGDSGEQQRKPEQRKGKTMPTTIAENLSAFSARRQSAIARMNELMTVRAEKGETLDDAESTEYEGLKTEVTTLDKHLERLSEVERINKQNAVPAVAANPAEAAASRQGNGPTLVNRHGEQVLRLRPNCHPTSGFIRLCIALGAANGDPVRALAYAKRRVDWHSSTPEILQVLESDEAMYKIKAAVPAGVTYDSTWAGPLIYAENLTSAFAEFLRPLTIIGRFATLRRVPFNIRVPRVTAGTSGGWVGESAPKPVTSMALDSITMTWAKIAAIVVITEELARFSNPAAEDMVRTDLARSITQFMDRAFIDPSLAAVAGVSPASITNSVTPITPTGVNMAAFRADMKTLFNQLLVTNQSLAGGYFIMTQQQAMALSIAQNSLGQVIYPTISPDMGGTILGYPVIASENIPATGGSPVEGYPLIFAIGPEIMLADDGQVTINTSREASVQMDSTPDSPPTGSTNLQSLWQLNAVGLRAERYVTWLKRRTSAVAWIQNAKYAE